MIDERGMENSRLDYRTAGLRTDGNYSSEISVIADPLKGFKSISWSAVLAGVVVAMALQVVMGVLGIGIGAANVDPLYDSESMKGLGTSASVWFIVSGLIALFFGGWVSGRLAGIPRAADSALHGFITWSFATLAAVYLLGTTLGSLTGGVFKVLGGTVAAVTTGATNLVKAAGPSVVDSAKTQLEQNGLSMDLSDFQDQATALFKQSEAPDSSKNSPATDIVKRFTNSPDGTLNESDRKVVSGLIVSKTGKSPEEADQIISTLQTNYQIAKQKFEQTKIQAEQKAREIGQKSAEVIARGALWGVIAMLLGASAASAGGYLATRRHLELETDHSTALKH